jgi:hypothetical protein
MNETEQILFVLSYMTQGMAAVWVQQWCNQEFGEERSWILALGTGLWNN